MNRLPVARRIVLTAALVGSAWVGGSGAACAQESDPAADNARQLILRIRSSMRQIDRLLLEGADAASADAELAANQRRIDELLDQSEQKSGGVVQDIDQLIQLGKQQQGQSGQSGQSGGPPPPGSSPPGDPQGQDQAGRKRQKSQDPGELPQQGEQGDRPQGEPRDQKSAEESRRDGQPQGGETDPSKGEQREGGKPPPGATGEFERTDLSGRWGMLPPKEAEQLQRRSADEFPQRYRPWMELYFRRMSRLPARR